MTARCVAVATLQSQVIAALLQMAGVDLYHIFCAEVTYNKSILGIFSPT
jgi:cytochrome c oxidase assembly protein Cox11